jgi:hypothetical protein
MLAERIPTILPRLDRAAALEVTAIHSVAGTLPEQVPLLTDPPFLAPHHTATKAAIVGGGSGVIRPGSASLAHRGVLFLDEAPEFARDVLDALRQPLEAGEVVVARSGVTTTFPARFTLVLAANPCPCARAAGPAEGCSCSPARRRAAAPGAPRQGVQAGEEGRRAGDPAGDRRAAPAAAAWSRPVQPRRYLTRSRSSRSCDVISCLRLVDRIARSHHTIVL